MMLVKLTEMEDGVIRAETSRAVIGEFEDMTIEEVMNYLADRAEEVGEPVRFVDEFYEREEVLDFRHLMKGKKKK